MLVPSRTANFPPEAYGGGFTLYEFGKFFCKHTLLNFHMKGRYQNMNFQQTCQLLEEWAGQELEPIVIQEYDVNQKQFKPIDTGARKTELNWEHAEAFMKYMKERKDHDVHVLFMYGNETKVEVAVGKSESMFEILRWAETSGCNYGLETEDLVKELKKIDQKYGGIEVIQATHDSLELRLKKLPDDIIAFINDLNSFCPDLRAQMFHDDEELVTLIKKTYQVPLWWD
jgi:hypothetical protein